MTQLLIATQPRILIGRNDLRLVPMEQQDGEPEEDFRSSHWPRGGGFIGGLGVDVGLLESVWYEQPEMTRGISARLAFLGTTRDQYGSALASCVVLCYRTADRSFVFETVSDANGNYTAVTWFADAHFLVFYKAGSPDVFGSTVNTLVGS